MKLYIKMFFSEADLAVDIMDSRNLVDFYFLKTSVILISCGNGLHRYRKFRLVGNIPIGM